MSSAAVLLIWNGASVPSLDVLPFPIGSWAKRIPLVLLFVLTYAITVARYFATTTTHVEELTAPSDETDGRSAGTARTRVVRRL
jgi:hypothetical protein